ncbi:hypothetical protein [Paractinoplanes brasiliensis]|uniref:hypothetical protein n=1 Tax=Paractinoplanes brasiliensis TaxID=52695 RepID=UPI001FB60206|nr:hypothetical protein [Actinoplanes brasiliensis]
MPGPTVTAYEEQAGVGPGGAGGQLPLRSLGFVTGEQSDGVRVEDDVAVTGFALGLLVADVSAAVRGDLVDDADLGFAEAYFGVEQAAGLAAAGAAVGHEVQHRVDVGRFGGGVVEEVGE